MKKATKILILALSLSLLCASVFCLGASASDSDDASLKIISKNISHEAEVKILFAVDDTNLGLDEEATVVYTLEDPAVNPETEIFTATEYEKGFTNDGTTYPAFITAGFPGSKFDKYVYAAAVVKGTELTEIPTNFVRYSVLEYLNEKLYEDELDEDRERLGYTFEKVVLTDYQPTCENMLADFAERLLGALPEEVELYSLRLHETATSFAEWYASDNF